MQIYIYDKLKDVEVEHEWKISSLTDETLQKGIMFSHLFSY